MRLKSVLIICIIITYSFNRVSFAQVTKKNNKVTFDLNINKVYDSPVKYNWDTILINRSDYDNKEVVFKQVVSFVASKFKDTANFSYSKFMDTANFVGSRFPNPADFYYSTFQGNANFTYARFKNTAFFWDSVFKNVSDFSGSSFLKIADFEFVKFNKIVDFSNIITSDSTIFYFSNSLLPPLINFSGNTVLKQTVDFSSANFNRTNLYSAATRKWHYINLYNSEIAQIKIDYQHFRLCFYQNEDDNSLGITFSDSGFIYKTIKYKSTDYQQLLKIDKVRNYLQQIFPSAKWTDTVVTVFLINCIQKKIFPAALSDDEIISTYEKVLKNFDVAGQKISYENLDIEYKDFKNGWFIIPHIWYCYGYHKEWIFGWSLGFIILFTISTYFLLDRLNGGNKNEAIYHMANIPSLIEKQTFRPCLRRLWYSLMYTSTLFFFISAKNGKS
jgi:uncharacterized protein YjbI with pentapeptide repeats